MKLIATSKDDEFLYFFLEPVLGGALHCHLRRCRGHRLLEDTVAVYAAELICALVHIHSRGCMHRDIKASNCILDSSGHIKLCDFSAAKVIEEITEAGPRYTYTLIGTPEFMSPEMLLRRVGYTYASDAWSLGVLVHEMLLGCRPFTSISKDWLGQASVCDIEADFYDIDERNELLDQFYEQNCKEVLFCPDRGVKAMNGFDFDNDPISPSAWRFITQVLLVGRDTKRLDTKDLDTARRNSFLGSVDWTALLTHSLPPIQFDRTIDQLHSVDKVFGECIDDGSELSTEQQQLFEGF